MSNGTAGAILAGGRSSRMGSDKALLPLNGRPMIQHIADTMRSVVDRVCVVSDRTDSYRSLNLEVIADLVKGAGPIGGIHAALRTLDVPAVLIAGCDTPFLSASLLQYLLDAPGSAPAVVARAPDGIHPLSAVYRRGALPTIEKFLRDERFKLIELLDELGADIVDVTPNLPFYRSDLFVNVNDPAVHDRIDGRS